jgi:hypothetical protein
MNLGVGSTLSGIVVNSTSGATKDAHLITGASVVDNRVLSGCAAADADGVLRPSDGRLCEAGAYERVSSTLPAPLPNLLARIMGIPRGFDRLDQTAVLASRNPAVRRLGSPGP